MVSSPIFPGRIKSIFKLSFLVARKINNPEGYYFDVGSNSLGDANRGGVARGSPPTF
jgi:hypothetical protein